MRFLGSAFIASLTLAMAVAIGPKNAAAGFFVLDREGEAGITRCVATDRACYRISGQFQGSAKGRYKAAVTGVLSEALHRPLEFTYYGGQSTGTSELRVDLDGDGRYETKVFDNGPNTKLFEKKTYTNLLVNPKYGPKEADDGRTIAEVLFSFRTNFNNGPWNVENGSDNGYSYGNGPTATLPSFFVSFLPPATPDKIEGNDLMLFYNDGVYRKPQDPDAYGFFPDGQPNSFPYDDMAVRLRVVPVPAALPLMITALASVGLAGWVRHRKTGNTAA